MESLRKLLEGKERVAATAVVAAAVIMQAFLPSIFDLVVGVVAVVAVWRFLGK